MHKSGGGTLVNCAEYAPLGVDISHKQKSCFGIYVHVPFCVSVCSYCDFVKTSKFDRHAVDVFFANCEKQLLMLLSDLPAMGSYCTLYFGGGTPGIFPAERFAPLIDIVRSRFEIEECSIETNPWVSGLSRYRDLRRVGFTRVTVGVQSLCSKTLSLLGRKHTGGQALKAVSDARNAGFAEVQADLIYGLRNGFRATSVSDEVVQLVQAGATGVSAYALTLERRTKLFGSDCVSEDAAILEYGEIADACLSLGMMALETSNFSFFEAKHNNIYWYGWPYIGVGTGAHGLLPAVGTRRFGRRYSVGAEMGERNPGDDFLPFVSSGEELFKMVLEEERTQENVFEEGVFTLLRTPLGIPWKWVKDIGYENVESIWRNDSKIKRAVDAGRMDCTTDGIRLLGKEFLLGDSWSLHLLSIADPKTGVPATSGHHFP